MNCFIPIRASPRCRALSAQGATYNRPPEKHPARRAMSNNEQLEMSN